jgi:hypothetical protein
VNLPAGSEDLHRLPEIPKRAPRTHPEEGRSDKVAHGRVVAAKARSPRHSYLTGRVISRPGHPAIPPSGSHQLAETERYLLDLVS